LRDYFNKGLGAWRYILSGKKVVRAIFAKNHREIAWRRIKVDFLWIIILFECIPEEKFLPPLVFAHNL
jgi:hypothetical protein